MKVVVALCFCVVQYESGSFSKGDYFRVPQLWGHCSVRIQYRTIKMQEITGCYWKKKMAHWSKLWLNTVCLCYKQTVWKKNCECQSFFIFTNHWSMYCFNNGKQKKYTLLVFHQLHYRTCTFTWLKELNWLLCFYHAIHTFTSIQNVNTFSPPVSTEKAAESHETKEGSPLLTVESEHFGTQTREASGGRNLKRLTRHLDNWRWSGGAGLWRQNKVLQSGNWCSS